MSAAYFIAGTDTDVGKTTIATGLLYAARQSGLSTAAGKPVASGCDVKPKGLRNPDAVALRAECSIALTYNEVNPIALGLPVILVVGVRLGCISHALLSAEAIASDGLQLAGWVANIIDPKTSRLEENLATLAERLPAPCLGRVPHMKKATPEKVAEHLHLELLD